MGQLYLRTWKLIVSANGDGIDLSELRIVFRISQADVDAPNTAVIRIYNLAQTTAKRIQNEFQRVTLQAGYEGSQSAIIFDGTIKQVRTGRESAIDSFVDIYAADGDEAYNFAVVNKSLAAGSTLNTQIKAVAEATQKYGVDAATTIPTSLGTGGTLPRGKVLFGMARERMTDIAATGAASWSIQNGKITVIPLTGYLAGEAVVLSARTGMILVPESTNNGIEATLLLNPLIKIGTRVQIDNASINQTTVKQQGFPRYTDLSFPATVTNDGFYRVLVAEHEGDNRGQQWYTKIICLAVDPSSAPEQSVLADG